MSQIAEQTGIGRATLYKYFPDIDAIPHAWQERRITSDLAQLAETRDHATDPEQRLEAVPQADPGLGGRSGGAGEIRTTLNIAAGHFAYWCVQESPYHPYRTVSARTGRLLAPHLVPSPSALRA